MSSIQEDSAGIRSKLIKIAAAASAYERFSVRSSKTGTTALSDHERAANRLIDAVRELSPEARELLEMA